MNQKISQIKEHLDKYFVFCQCRFSLREKGLFVHCPEERAKEVYRYRHIVLAAAMEHGISGFVILLVAKNRYAGTRISLENFIALKRFALEILYREENYFRK